MLPEIIIRKDLKWNMLYSADSEDMAACVNIRRVRLQARPSLHKQLFRGFFPSYPTLYQQKLGQALVDKSKEALLHRFIDGMYTVERETGKRPVCGVVRHETALLMMREASEKTFGEMRVSVLARVPTACGIPVFSSRHLDHGVVWYYVGMPWCAHPRSGEYLQQDATHPTVEYPLIDHVDVHAEWALTQLLQRSAINHYLGFPFVLYSPLSD